MKPIWTELSVKKFEEFADYIGLDYPNAAFKWTKKIQSSIIKLLKFPNIGPKVPKIIKQEFREIIEGNYRIIYRVEPDRISILTIRHLRQLLQKKYV